MPRYRKCRPEASATPTAYRARGSKARSCTRPRLVLLRCPLARDKATGQEELKVLRARWPAPTSAMALPTAAREMAAATDAAAEFRPAGLDRNKWFTADRRSCRLIRDLIPIRWKSHSRRSR